MARHILDIILSQCHCCFDIPDIRHRFPSVKYHWLYGRHDLPVTNVGVHSVVITLACLFDVQNLDAWLRCHAKSDLHDFCKVRLSRRLGPRTTTR